jgi:hypothetical protein
MVPGSAPPLGKESCTVSEGVATSRLYLMRFLYLLTFVGLGLSVWPGLIRHAGVGDLLQAAAISFGTSIPAKNVAFASPATALQVGMVNRSALPLSSTGRSSHLTKPFVIGVVLDLIGIPWSYVLTDYVKKGGDRWR